MEEGTDKQTKITSTKTKLMTYIYLREEEEELRMRTLTSGYDHETSHVQSSSHQSFTNTELFKNDTQDLLRVSRIAPTGDPR